VPTEQLDSFDDKLQASLKRIAQDGIDMERMAMVIDRDERQLRSKVESSKGDTFSGNVITDFLYGAEDGSHLGSSLDDISRYAVLRKWTNEDWVRLLKQYVLKVAVTSVVAHCSQTLH
jgi:Zn-dependent M16 (insulinase) family peptidase